MKRVYYAHPMVLYNTTQELADVVTLQALGLKVYNPNNPTAQAGAKKEGMAWFEGVVKGCDFLAFRSLPNGDIGSGVGMEIKWAQEKDVPIIELPSLALRRVLTHAETRAYMRELGR
jgi:hypothetical protein